MSSLEGLRVVVTRAAHQVSELVDQLQAFGAIPLVVPVIDIVDPDDGGVALREAFADISGYAWLVVTSVNTVERLPLFDIPPTLQIAAIGSGTAERLRAEHLDVSIVPPEFVAESLLDVFPFGSGQVLLPRAAIARDVLPDGLRLKGWRVEVVDAYKTVALTPDAELLEAALVADVVTFTAPSTVRAFVHACDGRLPQGLVACIGTITEAVVREAGMRADVVAREHTIEGLVSALVGR